MEPLSVGRYSERGGGTMESQYLRGQLIDGGTGSIGDPVKRTYGWV